MSANQDIESYVKSTFGNTAFAFVQSYVLPAGATCRSAGIYKSTGFTVKRTILVKRQHRGETYEYLSKCKDISEVVRKLQGDLVYCSNNRLLQPLKLLDDVIIESDNNFFLYVTSKTGAASFIFSHSILTTAKQQNGAAIFAKTKEYGIYSHYLAVKLYDA